MGKKISRPQSSTKPLWTEETYTSGKIVKINILLKQRLSRNFYLFIFSFFFFQWTIGRRNDGRSFTYARIDYSIGNVSASGSFCLFFYIIIQYFDVIRLVYKYIMYIYTIAKRYLTVKRTRHGKTDSVGTKPSRK